MSQKTYQIKTLPNSKLSKIVEESGSYIKIKLTEPAHDNKANKALIAFLSNYFKIAKNKITIVSGEKSHNKIVKIK